MMLGSLRTFCNGLKCVNPHFFVENLRPNWTLSLDLRPTFLISGGFNPSFDSMTESQLGTRTSKKKTYVPRKTCSKPPSKDCGSWRFLFSVATSPSTQSPKGGSTSVLPNPFGLSSQWADVQASTSGCSTCSFTQQDPILVGIYIVVIFLYIDVTFLM